MTDLEALHRAAALTWELFRARVLPGGAEWLVDRPDLTVRGTSFRIEFRLQQDLLKLGGEERTMIALRFAPRGEPVPDPPWTLYVRGQWANRAAFGTVGSLRARRLRKAFSPKRRPTADPSLLILRGGDVYLMAGTPAPDLDAQLCLFVLQTELSNDSVVFSSLADYLLRTFRIPVKDRLDRREIATEVATHLTQDWWWPEDARAWRKYVNLTIRAAVRRHRPEIVVVAALDGLRPAGATQHVANHASRLRHGPATREASRALDGASALALTVEQASQQLGVHLSTLYRWVHEGKVAVRRGSGRFVINQAELARLQGRLTVRSVVLAVAKARGCSEEAARRFVSRRRRRGESLDDLLAAHKVAEPPPARPRLRRP